MSKITALKPCRKKGRFNVYLDEKYLFSASEETLVKYKLKPDKELNSDEIKKITDEENLSYLFSRMLNLLSYKKRTKKEILDRIILIMKKRKAPDLDILKDKVIEKLENLNLINDEDYAKSYIEEKISGNKPLGRNKITADLLRRGISRDIFENFFEAGTGLEIKSASKLAEKKLKFLKGNNSEKRSRLSRYLYGKGYQYDIITSVIDTIFNLH